MHVINDLTSLIREKNNFLQFAAVMNCFLHLSYEGNFFFYSKKKKGEVTETTHIEAPSNFEKSYGSTDMSQTSLSQVIVGLKTQGNNNKQIKLAPQIYDNLLKNKVSIGDIIYIDAATGRVTRVGRCDKYGTEFDLEKDNYVPLPKGVVHKKKEITQEVTLHDLDVANAKPNMG
ncbi:hypothetical protein RFI_02507 [Reticulomyxa filosa]|uniref:RuvB-like helicase n=1 Tax=Reticulomyxa filosa TaxID=46433 RepID=X6P942_RETFI|nr:hypothetical protein RFI_02507 [Reticulomyxa filosa]|eukprot:ETO34584.1 hypothetical protein RFI_02507 [Reticulomyxa filosa]